VSNGVIQGHRLAAASKVMTRSSGDWAVWEDSDLEKMEKARVAPHLVAENQNKAACLLAAYTGQRLSDILSLRYGQYDRKQITFVQSKTFTQVVLPMTARIEDVLPPCESQRAMYSPMERVFWAFKTEAQFKASYYRLCKYLDIQKPFHGLRKYCATKLAEKGCTIPEIMSVTGHKSMTTVAMYVKTADKWLLAKKAMEKLDA